MWLNVFQISTRVICAYDTSLGCFENIIHNQPVSAPILEKFKGCETWSNLQVFE